MKANTFAAAVLMACMATAAPLAIQKRAGSTSGYTGGNTATDVTDGVCAPLTVIFARGTSESGTVGSVVGPGLFNALLKDTNNAVALQGVDYPASVEGNANLGADGGPTMAKLAQQALSQCPSTKIALAGYSQGALVVHNAVQSQGLSASSVAAVALYGDPEDGTSVGSVPAASLKEFCASGDGVCEDHGFDITAAHLSYSSNGDPAAGATFIVQTAGAGGNTSAAAPAAASSAAAAPAAASSASAAGGLGALGGLGSLGGTGTSTGAGGLGSLSSLGGLGASSTGSGLGSLTSGSAGLGSLGGLGGSTGSSGLGSLGGTGTSSGLGSLTSGTAGGLGSLGGLGGSSTGSGLGSLGGSTGGLGSLGGASGASGLGSLGGTGTSSGLGSLTSGLGPLGGESGASGLGSLGGSTGTSGLGGLSTAI